MQLSKRRKEPVEQPLFRVSETIAPHSPPSTHPRRILPKSPPPTPQPRRILAEPAPNPHRITAHASRNHGRTFAARSISAPPVPPAESGIPLRYSRATSAAGYETHSRCGCPPLVSTARILEDRPAPPTTSRKTDMPNHPKTSPPPATGRALRQRKNTPLPPQPKTATHRASKSPMRKPASTGRLHPILRPTSRPTIRTIRNRPTQPHLRLATTRTRPSLPGSAEPKHALPVPPHPATSAATAASGRGKEAVTQPRDPNCAL